MTHFQTMTDDRLRELARKGYRWLKKHEGHALFLEKLDIYEAIVDELHFRNLEEPNDGDNQGPEWDSRI